MECLEEALRFGRPEIFNNDQGVQFTSIDFTQKLLDARIRISMDGRGRVFDNIFIERLWRTVKYGNIYIQEYLTMSAAHNGLGKYFNVYNTERLHQSLDYQTPWEVYSGDKILSARSRKFFDFTGRIFRRLSGWLALRSSRREAVRGHVF